ncbi:MAG: WD40 repeat domain-containing protein, partial [Bacteroidia bacterium]|nr:WD40 repeat domain-containing protein [Bacteroidia bacterium]
LQVWPLQNKSESTSMIGHEALSALAFSPTVNYLLTAGLDKLIKVWDMKSQQIVQVIAGPEEQITDLSLNADATQIAISGGNYLAKQGEIKVFSREGIILYKLGWAGKGHTHVVNSLDFSPDGQYLVSGAEDGVLKIWDMSTGQEFKELTEPYTNITKVRFSPDGKLIATSSKKGTISLWHVATGQKIATYQGHTGKVMNIAFSPDGQYLASAGTDKTVKLWPAFPVRRMIELNVEEKVRAWQQRGKFEKTEEYQARVNPSTRQAIIEQFTQEALNEVGRNQVDWTVLKTEYDADHEVFKLSFRNAEPILLAVPVAEAPDFDQHFNELIFENSVFGLSPDDRLVYARFKLLTRPTTAAMPITASWHWLSTRPTGT